MQVINLSQDGQLRHRDICYLGGCFSWMEVIRMGGVGSSKFIYESGVDGFDQLKEVTTASNYVSLDLHKEGLAIRFKKQNDFKACLLRYDDIEEIKVISQRIRVFRMYMESFMRYRGRPKIVHQANIDVLLLTGTIKLKLQPTYYNTGIDFMKKSTIKGRSKFILLPEIIEELTPEIGWLARS